MPAQKVNWPQACRAESAITSYSTALDYFKRYPADIAVKRIEEKIAEKRVVMQQWHAQQDEKRTRKANDEYHAQAHQNDD